MCNATESQVISCDHYRNTVLVMLLLADENVDSCYILLLFEQG